MTNQEKFKIAHVAPFAPNRCGLYEAARDMAFADARSGHSVYFIDAGIPVDGVLEAPKIGEVDDRLGFRLETCHPDLLNDADIIIMHTGFNDCWLVKNTAPLIWAVHGRPLACFRPEQNGQGNSFELYTSVAKWKRTKKMLYFWNEFVPNWKPFFEGKDLVLNYPVIDTERFAIDGEKYDIKDRGTFNILVCDSSREDIDLYETFAGLIEYSKTNKDVKIHFVGFEYEAKNCWQQMLGKLKELGTLGDVHQRVTNMELVYRSMDMLISPNRIVTRTVAEALSCGIKVLCQRSTRAIQGRLSCDFAYPREIANHINVLRNAVIPASAFEDIRESFCIDKYSSIMDDVYCEVLKNG